MARGIAARYIRERPRGGRNNVLVDVEMRKRLKDIINETELCCYTKPHKWRVAAKSSLKPLIHDRAAAQSLEGICFALNWFGPFQQKQRWCFAKKARIWKLVHEQCHYAPLCFYRSVRLQHMECQESREGKAGWVCIKTSMRPARTERDCGPSNIARRDESTPL